MSTKTNKGFSLTEVMLAIFILGIGVIAVAALFPAGIAQQRQSSDDILGPSVANNALSILRSKLKPEDFGTFEDFGVLAQRVTIEGDWPWMRPGIAMQDDPSSPNIDERGWYDVFSWSALNAPTMQTATEFPLTGYVGSTPVLYGIPYNRQKYGAEPLIVISQGERYFPMAHARTFTDPNFQLQRPQYVWDCMFRRFQGRILVAIFVYRVVVPGAGDIPGYRVPPNVSNPLIPPLPVWVNLNASMSYPWAANPWDAVGDDPGDPFDDAIIPNTDPSSDPNYNILDVAQSWQAPGQWLLDQNNHIHRVLNGRRYVNDGPVELVRPVPAVPLLGPPSNPYLMPYYVLGPNAVNMGGLQNVVSDIWYIPIEVDLDLDGDMNADYHATLTPVYVTVREL